MVKLRVITLVCFIVSFYSFGKSVNEYKDETIDVFNNVIELIYDEVSPDEQIVLDEIEISTTSRGMNALAGIKDDKNIIIVSLPLVYLIEQISMGIAHTMQSNSDRCLSRYIDKQIEHVNILSSTGKLDKDDLTELAYLDFARKNKRTCGKIQQNSEFRDNVLMVMNISMTWLLLHEIAHHTLGHTKQAKIQNQCSVMDRDTEKDADLWAVYLMNEINIPYYAADSMHLFFLFTDAIDGLSSRASCHYQNAKRVIYMLKFDKKTQRNTRCNGAGIKQCEFVIETINWKIKNVRRLIRRLG